MLAAPALLAQQDIRIVPPMDGYLPLGDAAIQSAARTGDHALAVWGSVVADTAPLGRNILRMQMFRGAGIQGEQRTITTASALPSGSVRVLALRDQFAVIWNDRRPDAPGIYMQRVDTGGSLRGPETRVSDRTATTATDRGIMASGSPVHGYMIIWEEEAGPHMPRLHRIDPEGIPDAGDIPLDAPLLEEIRTALLPGVTILRMDKRDDEGSYPPGYMIRDGRLDPRRIPSLNLSGNSFHIGADTSSAVLVGSNLYIFKSIFDSVPRRRVDMESDLGFQAMLSRDTAGRYLLYLWNVVDDPGSPLHARIDRIVVDDSVRSGLEVALDHEHVPDPPAGWIDSVGYFTNVGWERHCGGAILTFTYSWLGRDSEGRPARRTEYDRFAVDAVGRIFEGTDRLESDCSDITITRRLSTGASLVVVEIDASEIELMHPLGDIVAPPEERYPNIVTRDGIPVVTLQNETPSSRPQLLRFDRSLASAPALLAGFDTLGRSLRIPGAAAVWRETSTRIPRASDTIFRSSFTLTKGAWFGWYASGVITANTLSDIRLRPVDVAYDPNTDQLIAAVELPYRDRRRRVSVMMVGGSSWTADSLPTSIDGDFQIMPIAGEQFFLIADDTATMFTPFGAVARIALPRSPSDTRYQRLLGNRFVRSFAEDSSRGLYTIELHTLQGELLASRTLTLQGATEAPFIVENPATQALALLYPADGVRLAYVDAMLRPLALEARVSEAETGVSHPAGSFLDDTLQVVWEDMRNGSLEIYGSWWKPVTTTAVDEVVGIDPLSIAIAPNPASDRAMARVRSRHAGPATLELVDMRGRSVLRRQIMLAPGEQSSALDVGDLAPGVYNVVVGGVGSARIIVQ
jgi:hypothetical protein